MKEELTLSNVIVSFENLNELVATLDEFIELHSKVTSKYEDRLGILLRESSSGKNQDQAGLSGLDEAASERRDEKKSKKEHKGSKEDKRRGLEEPDWISLGNEDFSLKIASQRPESIHNAEVSALFKVVENLKSKLTSLDLVRKLLSELPARGYRVDQRILVVFKDGIPRQIVPTSGQGKKTERFRYAERFQISALK